MKLRTYQSDLRNEILKTFDIHQTAMAVQATRTGKTVLFSAIMDALGVPSIAIAHRRELISQMSLALARYGITHRIVAPKATIDSCVRLHVKELGRSYYSPRASRGVASVDTLSRRTDQLADWLATIRLWVVDEAHHITGTNKWAKAVSLFPNAKGLGVTATPIRADGKGLGRHSGGVFDVLCIGLQAREAIAQGWLLDHKIYAPMGDYHRPDTSELGSTGDYKHDAIVDSIRKSHIVGDVVKHYLRLVPGKTAVVFASDVKTGTEIAADFNAAGVPARVVSAKTPEKERTETLRLFAARKVLVLVNVDLFGEGTDLPDLEVVIMARPTESFALFAQQAARASTPIFDGPPPETVEGRLAAIAASVKPYAIIIDHVGNVARHATAVRIGSRTVIDLAYGEWTLDAREGASRDKPKDAIPLRTCLNPTCMQVYERVLPECPYCGTHPKPASRSAPEFVDGDLTELDPAALAVLRLAVAEVDKPVEDYTAELVAKHCPPIGIRAHAKRHAKRQEAQAGLRDAIAWWAGYQGSLGRGTAERYRRFWFAFGIDVESAKALGTEEALELRDRVSATISGPE